jgi:ABC-type multidrug transport system fused ATPase/permease subunit
MAERTVSVALTALLAGLGSRRTISALAGSAVMTTLILTHLGRREQHFAVEALPRTQPAKRKATLDLDVEDLDIDDEAPPKSPLARRVAAQTRAKTFNARLASILRICMPSLCCKETFALAVITVCLFARTALSIAVAVTTGQVAASLVAADWAPFLKGLRRFAVIGVPAAFVNSGLKYQTQILSLRFQRRLTEHLNQQYITGVNFYKATELPQFRIDNIDQRVTTDVEVFCDQITELYTSLVKPGLDVVLNTWKMALDMGWRGPAVLFGYFFLAAAVKVIVMPNFKELVKKKSELSGNYRTAHSRLIAHAEEIAFYEGGLRERSIVRQRFDALYWHSRRVATLKLNVGVLDTWIEKYGASIAGYFVMCLPIFFVTKAKTVAENTMMFVQTRQLMMDLARGLGMLLTVQTQVKMLSGITVRVAEVFEAVKQLNENGTMRFEVKEEGPSAAAASPRIQKSVSTLFRQDLDFLHEWDSRNHELRAAGKLHVRREEGASPVFEASDAPRMGGSGGEFRLGPEVELGLYPIVTLQYSSTTLYQVSYHIR